MRRLLAMAVLAACGGDGMSAGPCRDVTSSTSLCPGDGARPAMPACDPRTQAGCMAMQKCAWNFHDRAMACAAIGAVRVGGACTILATGISDCEKGTECDDGACRGICGTDDGAPYCDSTSTCVIRPELFVFEVQNVAGVCQPSPP